MNGYVVSLAQGHVNNPVSSSPTMKGKQYGNLTCTTSRVCDEIPCIITLYTKYTRRIIRVHMLSPRATCTAHFGNTS